MRRLTGAAAVIVVLAIAATAFAGDHVRVIVGFNGAPDGAVFAAHGGQAHHAIGGANALVGFLPPGSFAGVKADPNVA